MASINVPHLLQFSFLYNTFWIGHDADDDDDDDDDDWW